MSHLQAKWLAAIAMLRSAILRGAFAERCAAWAACFSFEHREELRRRERLRRSYADLISRLIEPHAGERERRELEKRLWTLDLEELQKLYAGCLRVADAPAVGRRRCTRRKAIRDALWELTPLLK